MKLEELFTYDCDSTDIQTKHINGRGLPVVSASKSDILGYSDIPSKVFCNAFTVNKFGDVRYWSTPL